MFEVGTKIRLLASSCERTTGPRRGSTGYVSSILGSVVLEQLSLCASLTEVVFFRYGFETKERVEKKSVVLVFPIISKEGKGDVHQQVKAISDKVLGRGGNEWKEPLMSYFDCSNSTTMALAAPVQISVCSLADCSKSEFAAWVDSLLNSQELTMFLHEASAHRHYTNSNFPGLNRTSTWDTLRHMSLDRSYKLARVDNWLKDSTTRETSIRALRAVTIMSGAREFKSKRDALAQAFLGIQLKKPIEPGRFYEYTQMILMRKALVDSLAEMARQLDSKYLLSYTEDLEAVRGELLVLSARLERGNNTAAQ
jgi:hypothetical protein